jgi:hypothetical protein
LHKWKTIHCKAEKVQKIGHDFYLILWKAFGKAPTSSSMAEGQQEFHLHTTGFETQNLFGGFGFPEWAVSVSLHQPSNDDQSFSCCRVFAKLRSVTVTLQN